jgi:8-oxo-dGTP diphosphatase
LANPQRLPEVCVVYLIRDAATGSEVLLGRKLTGLGKGKVVAPGGKLEAGESPVDAAVREVREEVGLAVAAESLELLGKLTYVFPTKTEWSQVSWAFRARGRFEDAAASDEIEASWVPIEDVPFNEMWDDAKYWLPDLFKGHRVVATFEFGTDLSSVRGSDHFSFGPSGNSANAVNHIDR